MLNFWLVGAGVSLVVLIAARTLDRWVPSVGGPLMQGLALVALGVRIASVFLVVLVGLVLAVMVLTDWDGVNPYWLLLIAALGGAVVVAAMYMPRGRSHD